MKVTHELGKDPERAMIADRYRLRRQIRGIEDSLAQGKPCDERMAKYQAELARSIERVEARKASVPAVTYDEQLPIAARRSEIAAAIQSEQVVVVCGETGSGKSTQLPKICLELGRGVQGLIGHTQPRRIAARSVAARVAEELNSPLGKAVGFKIRFTDTTSRDSYIKLMTDGILLAESQHDRFLDQYDTIIIDEAHERSLNIDFLLGYLRRLLPKRPDLKVIITSATIDAARFAEHFANRRGPAPVLEVAGRTYPVEVRYRPLAGDDADDLDWQSGVLGAIDEICRIGVGDALVFLPTERDIHEMMKSLRGFSLQSDPRRAATEIVPLYARLSTAEQQKVFEPHKGRRIVLATNVAESSLTVPGIRYVIDVGTARISRYSPRSKMARLPIEPVSQASADQRKGRCGRIGPGVCIRLYDEADFQSRDRYTPPEIQRTNLAGVILQAKVLGLGDLEEFPFLDPPRTDSLRDGYKTLFELGAIEENRQLTDLGRQLGRLPVDPRIARIIVAGHVEHCLHEVLIIAAALESQDPRERPIDKQQAADAAHARFLQTDSDFLGYLKLWDFYNKLKGEVSRNQLRKACKQNFLSYNRMREWLDVHLQLLELIESAGLKLTSRKDDYAAIHRALLTGFLSNIGQKTGESEYTMAGGNKVVLWPGSGVVAKKPKWIVAAEQLETTRCYARCVARIDPQWIEPLAGHLVTKSYSEAHWSEEQSTALVYEKVSLFGLPIVPRRLAKLGTVNAEQARSMFIQYGLVEGQYESRGKFQAENQKLLDELAAIEAKSRRQDWLRGEQARYEFFDARLPDDAYDGPRFETWRKAAEAADPRLLLFARRDLVHEDELEVSPQDFPDAIPVQRMDLPLDYEHAPGESTDGITIVVPQEGLNQLDPERLGWLVPGLLEEKVVALVKSLPKHLRRNFVPIPDTAKHVAARIKYGEGSIVASVAGELGRMIGATIPLDAFQPDKIPLHLQMNIRVVDRQGETLASGRDLVALKSDLGDKAAASFASVVDPRWQRDGITAWDFGDLPAQVEFPHAGMTMTGFPAIVDQGEAVGLRLFETPEKAQLEMQAGLRRLFWLAVRKDLKTQVNMLPKLDQMTLHAASLGTASLLKAEIAELLVERTFLPAESMPTLAAQFQSRLATGRKRLGLAVQELSSLLPPLFQAYHQARLAVDRATQRDWQPAVADIREQLVQLLIPGFLVHTPWPWLQQFPRYFKAIAARLERLSSGGLARDRDYLALLAPRWKQYLDRAAIHAAKGIVDPELIAYRWMLEEYRVSLFAQTLGTVQPVSDKRLDKQWQKVQA